MANEYEDEYTQMCDEKIAFWKANKQFHIKVERMVQKRIFEMSDARDEEVIRDEVMTTLQARQE